jgi:cytochrome P450
MFGGGSDTAATMLQWIMAELISKPQLMHKAQEEVRREFIGHTKVTEDGIKNLDFMHMVIKETLRLHPPSIATPASTRVPKRQLQGFRL